MTESEWALPRCVSCGAAVAGIDDDSLDPAQRCPFCGLTDPANPANRVWRENGGHDLASWGRPGGDLRRAVGHGR